MRTFLAHLGVMQQHACQKGSEKVPSTHFLKLDFAGLIETFLSENPDPAKKKGKKKEKKKTLLVTLRRRKPLQK